MRTKNIVEYNYNYPIDEHWTTEEIIDVIHFFECVEKSYEEGINRETLMTAYRRFKEIAPGKAEERNIFAKFEKNSGYSAYHVMQQAKQTDNGHIIKL